MCSIFGAFGKNVDINILSQLRKNAGDRGRDGGRMEGYVLEGGYQCYLGNWRATPTTELQNARLQPYDGLVHNGTIANDKELGGRDGEIDSEVLARVLDRTDFWSLKSSLETVIGSYAIACHNGKSVFLACNYKPIYCWSPDRKTFYFSSMSRHFKNILPVGQEAFQIPPYLVVDLRLVVENQFSWAEIPRRNAKRAVVIASSGLDSTTVAWKLKSEGYEVHLLHFQYGCLAETREKDAVARIAEALGATFTVIPIPYTQMAGKAAIMQNDSENVVCDIQGAEYAHEWVPARNLVMLSIAAAFSESSGYHIIALGSNLEESGAYPDNEEQFTYLFDKILDYAVQNGYELRLVTPVGNLMKHEIVKMGLELGVPYELTWSCYRNGERHCGTCGPCYMRQKAFQRNNKIDPVEYEIRLDPDSSEIGVAQYV